VASKAFIIGWARGPECTIQDLLPGFGGSLNGGEEMSEVKDPSMDTLEQLIEQKILEILVPPIPDWN